MKTNVVQRAVLSALAAGALLALAPAGRAQQAYHVNFNTGPLASLGAPPAPFYLDFQLLDGGNPSNNTATISNFTFGTGGGAPTDDSGAVTTGAASGGLSAGTIHLSDASLFNELYQSFTPGSSLSFDVRLTTNPDTSPASSPDSFVFSILDSSQNPIPTLDGTGADSLVAIDISQTPTVTTYATDTSRGFPSDGSPTPSIAAPAVMAQPVPEASTCVSFGLILLGLAGGVWRCRRPSTIH